MLLSTEVVAVTPTDEVVVGGSVGAVVVGAVVVGAVCAAVVVVVVDEVSCSLVVTGSVVAVVEGAATVVDAGMVVVVNASTVVVVSATMLVAVVTVLVVTITVLVAVVTVAVDAVVASSGGESPPQEATAARKATRSFHSSKRSEKYARAATSTEGTARLAEVQRQNRPCVVFPGTFQRMANDDTEGSACCAPARPAPAGRRPDSHGGGGAAHIDQARGEPMGLSEQRHGLGGRFRMGSDDQWSYPGDGEQPIEVELSPFSLDTTAVSNEQFSFFVDATGYVTDAERFGWSFVFGGLLPDDFPETRGVAQAPWWRQVFGATWRCPEGGASSIDDRLSHPVVQVSANDATAYAAWAGRRLPTEAEWECAARAGTSTVFPWGDELEPGGEHRSNVFQGEFPGGNTAADGWDGTCPVDAYQPNAVGLHNMIGNVWEWTADGFETDRFRAADRRESTSDGAVVAVDPTCSSHGLPITLKGGSYLCHLSYCRRYRPAARMGSTADSAAGNIGFRCAESAA